MSILKTLLLLKMAEAEETSNSSESLSRSTETNEPQQEQEGCFVLEEITDTETSANHESGQLVYTCNHCNILLETEELNNEHVRNVHKVVKINRPIRQYLRFKCYKCNVISANKLELKIHLEKTHFEIFNNEKLLQIIQQKCPLCQKLYSNIVFLIEHCIQEHKCDKNAFKPIKDIEVSKSYKFKCPVCNKFVENPPLLYAHIKYNHEELFPDIEKKPLSVKSCTLCTYKCSYCTSVFTSEIELINHKKTQHTDEIILKYSTKLPIQTISYIENPLPVKCKICNISLENDNLLKIHLKQHDFNESGPSSTRYKNIKPYPNARSILKKPSDINTSNEKPVVYIKAKNKILTKVNGILTWVNSNTYNSETDSYSIPEIVKTESNNYELVPNTEFNMHKDNSRIPLLNSKVLPKPDLGNDYIIMDETINEKYVYESEEEIKIKKVKYYCPYCNACKKDLQVMKTHLVYVHKCKRKKVDNIAKKATTYSRKYQCDICQSRYKNIELLETHMEIEMLRIEKPTINFEYNNTNNSNIDLPPLKPLPPELMVKNRDLKQLQLLSDKMHELGTDYQLEIPLSLAKYVKIDYKYLYFCPKCNYKTHYHSQNKEHLIKIHKVKTIPLIPRKLTKVWVCNLCTRARNSHNRTNYYSTEMDFVPHFHKHHYNDNGIPYVPPYKKQQIPINKVIKRSYICLCCHDTFDTKKDVKSHQLLKNTVELGCKEYVQISWVCNECPENTSFVAERLYMTHYKEVHQVIAKDEDDSAMNSESVNIINPFDLVKCEIEENDVDMNDYGDVNCKIEVEDTEISDSNVINNMDTTDYYITPEFCNVGCDEGETENANDLENIVIKEEPIDKDMLELDE